MPTITSKELTTEDREASSPHGQEPSGIRARCIADSTVALTEYARRDLHVGAVRTRIWPDPDPRHRRDDSPDLDLSAPGVSTPQPQAAAASAATHAFQSRASRGLCASGCQRS